MNSHYTVNTDILLLPQSLKKAFSFSIQNISGYVTRTRDKQRETWKNLFSCSAWFILISLWWRELLLLSPLNLCTAFIEVCDFCFSKDGEEGGAAMHKTLRHSPFRSNFPVLRISLKLNSKAFPEDKAGRAFHQLARKRRKWTVMATAWKGRADRGTESLHSADRKL